MKDFNELVAAMLEGRLSERDRKRLEAILDSDPEARRVYLEQRQSRKERTGDPGWEESCGAAEPIGLDDDPETVENDRASIPKGGLRARLGLAVAALMIGGAAVLALTEVLWRSDSPSPFEGARLPAASLAAVGTDGSSSDKISFNSDVRPILSENCFLCHGPDAGTRKAELRLDIEGYAFVPHGKFGAAIIPGDAEASPLYRRIMSTLASEVMPPPDSHKSLDAAEKEVIRQWIDQGAEWEAHWAFIKPKKVQPAHSDWGNGPIDFFLAAKHKELGLEPNPQADRATLARRLSLDLTGLPPSPERVDWFIGDESPDAYENLVDTLLADPAYGEHQARFWLDAARYADTHGLHLDNYREIWPYRDWVIAAFNQNKPFDQFTIEQIAGDLLPEASVEQVLATGFNRCNLTTSEGGAIDEEYRAIYAKDRVETTATVYLGMTMGCAACHDHKFDPLSQKDFYGFAAFFNNLDGQIMDGNAYDTKPNIVIPDAKHVAAWSELLPRYEALGSELEKLKEERKADYEDWLGAWQPDLAIALQREDFVLDLREREESADGDGEEEGEGAARPSLEIPEGFANLGIDDPFTVTIKYKVPELEADCDELVLSQFDGDRGWRLFVLAGDKNIPNRYRFRFELVHSLEARDLISITTKSVLGSPSPGGEARINLSYDGSGKASGVAIGAPGRMPLDKASLVDSLRRDFSTRAPLELGGQFSPEKDGVGVSRIGFFADLQPMYALRHLDEADKLEAILRKKPEERSEKESDKLKNYYFDIVDPRYSAVKREQASLDSEYSFIYEQASISLVMKEKDTPAFAHILERGLYDQVGEKVAPSLPVALGSLPEDAPKNRLGLARWLVDRENPLTARVTVNRLWQNLFGTGLVKTSEDFGIMGENPSHPELLDWLAVEFQDNGWNVKDLIRQMVTSEAYKQDARIKKDEYLADPENRFLARGSRYRLDGEVLRDQALLVSGALREEIGGPPVKPYQPSGIWNAVAYSGSNTRFYHEDEGPGLYRRSIYTFWKRSAPPPNMTTFDAPSRETCSVRRDRTNTPLQALNLMNDPQYVEAARLLAQRALDIERVSTGRQIAAMYRLAFGVEAAGKHLQVLLGSYGKFEEGFRESPEDAESLIHYGHAPAPTDSDPVVLASLTMVANQIMNLDSFISKY